MTNGMDSTAPRPFIFVVMPFDSKFDDIYTFGIKGAAEDVGAYAERVDKQIFSEGILDRIYNQINKADVIVAELTDRNPNVFYEVGYAHALGKIVLLITQNSSDTPFDLQYRQYINYEGTIEKLRTDLTEKMRWAIDQAKLRQVDGATARIGVVINGVDIPEFIQSSSVDKELPRFRANQRDLLEGGCSFGIQFTNTSRETILAITHVYLLTSPASPWVPTRTQVEPTVKTFTVQDYQLNKPGFSNVHLPTTRNTKVPLTPMTATSEHTDGFTHQYRLEVQMSNIPPYAMEIFYLNFKLAARSAHEVATYRLRFYVGKHYYDYPFQIEIVDAQ